MGSPARVFHALNGVEVRTRVVQETVALLAGDTRFADSQHFESLTWRWVMTLEAYPMDPPQMSVTLQGSAMNLSGAEIRPRIAAAIQRQLDADTRFGLHLTFPKVTWSITLYAEVPKANAVSPVPQQVQVGPRELDFRALEPAPVRESAIVDPRAPLRAVVPEQIVDAQGRPVGGPMPIDPTLVKLTGMIADLQEQIAAMRSGTAPAVATPVVHEVVDHTRVPVNAITGTGLPIEGGARMPPGAAAELARSWGDGARAIAAVEVAGSQMVETIELGVSHPPLVEGGIGAPDAVRRAGGMTVPTPVNVPGVGTVDLQGSF